MLDSWGDRRETNDATTDTFSLRKGAKGRHIRLVSLLKYHKPKKLTFRNDTIAVNAILRYQKTIRSTMYKAFNTMLIIPTL